MLNIIANNMSCRRDFLCEHPAIAVLASFYAEGKDIIYHTHTHIYLIVWTTNLT